MKSLLMILLILPAAPALASTGQLDRQQAVVRYDDLDLHSSAGAAALRRRIDQTIVGISGGTVAPFELHANAELAKARAVGRAQADRLIANLGRSEDHAS